MSIESAFIACEVKATVYVEDPDEVLRVVSGRFNVVFIHRLHNDSYRLYVVDTDTCFDVVKKEFKK